MFEVKDLQFSFWNIAFSSYVKSEDLLEVYQCHMLIKKPKFIHFLWDLTLHTYWYHDVGDYKLMNNIDQKMYRQYIRNQFMDFKNIQWFNESIITYTYRVLRTIRSSGCWETRLTLLDIQTQIFFDFASSKFGPKPTFIIEKKSRQFKKLFTETHKSFMFHIIQAFDPNRDKRSNGRKGQMVEVDKRSKWTKGPKDETLIGQKDEWNSTGQNFEWTNGQYAHKTKEL